MTNIAIIPARGGSKRIPGKNIKSFYGQPIIAYPIKAALRSGLFADVIVSTDDQNIAGIAKDYGASVPFYRSKQNSDDHAGVADVILEVISNYSGEVDHICCILPTAPFITDLKISEAFEIMINQSFDAVISVQKFSYPIQRSLRIENNNLEMIWPENYQKRSQDLEDTYHDAGQFYWIKKKSLIKYKKLLIPNCGAYKIKETEGHDIDTEEDWINAEIKYKLLNKFGS